jgi:hypothetical protein
MSFRHDPSLQARDIGPVRACATTIENTYNTVEAVVLLVGILACPDICVVNGHASSSYGRSQIEIVQV